MQEIAHETVERYAVTLDDQGSEERARSRIGNWAYVFVKPGTLGIELWLQDEDGDGKNDTAYAKISAIPRIERLYLYEMPVIEKISRCTLEYKFREPEKFSGS